MCHDIGQRLSTGYVFAPFNSLASSLLAFLCLVALFLGLLLIGGRRYQLALNVFVLLCAFFYRGFDERSVLELFSNDVGIT